MYILSLVSTASLRKSAVAFGLKHKSVNETGTETRDAKWPDSSEKVGCFYCEKPEVRLSCVYILRLAQLDLLVLFSQDLRQLRVALGDEV